MEEIKKKEKLSKDTINIIRTTQRNNIDLTHIADNKANVLLSLNAIMITFLIPSVMANMDFIIDSHYYIPLIILAATCFSTIYISTVVLKPTRFDNLRDENEPKEKHSPFFFGNFYKMEPEDFYKFMDETIDDNENLKHHLMQDLYFIGRRLGSKMTWIRRAFNIFLCGIGLTLISSAIMFFIN